MLHKGEFALLAIFGAASGCATVVDPRNHAYYLMGREHNIDACYINWAAALNLRSRKGWLDISIQAESDLKWLTVCIETAARTALLTRGPVNVLKLEEHQDENVYRDQIAARIGRKRLRHFVAEKFPEFRIRGEQNPEEEVVLRDKSELSRILGGAVWDREYYASGKHVAVVSGRDNRRNVRPAGADSGGGRWWSPG